VDGKSLQAKDQGSAGAIVHPSLATSDTRSASGIGQVLPQRAWLSLPPTPHLPHPKASALISIDSAKIFYAEFGEGPPVILLHGGLANSNYWGHQVPGLARNFRVVVMDTRGHGKSTFVATPFTYRALASDVIGLMDFLHIDKAAIVGWSDGAIVGLEMAMTYPERTNRVFAFGANSNLSGINPKGSATPVFQQYVARTANEYRDISPNPTKYRDLSAQLYKMWKSEPNYTTDHLQKIQCPVVVSDGEYDEIILRTHLLDLSKSIRGSKLVIEPGVSHFAMLQNPPVFQQDVEEFLRI
jgi:pimeloyl-ACP methyl ester carboxylesterase